MFTISIEVLLDGVIDLWKLCRIVFFCLFFSGRISSFVISIYVSVSVCVYMCMYSGVCSMNIVSDFFYGVR